MGTTFHQRIATPGLDRTSENSAPYLQRFCVGLSMRLPLVGLGRLVVIGVVCTFFAACSTTLELIDPEGLRAAQSWDVVFRYEADGAILTDVPLEEGQTRQLQWNRRTPRERVFLRDVTHQLRVKYGITVVENQNEARAVMAFHLADDPVAQRFNGVDVFFTDLLMEEEFARLHISNQWNRNDFDLARKTAKKISKVLRGGG